MKVSYDLYNDYQIQKFNSRLRIWESIAEDEAEIVLTKGHIAPVSSGYYQAKVLIIGVIIDDQIIYYRANKK